MNQPRHKIRTRFRGRFEQLEARTVLSATGIAAGYELLHGVSEYAQVSPEFPRVEYPVVGFEQSRPTKNFDHSDRQDLYADGWRGEQEQSDVYFVVIVTYRPPLFASSREPAVPATDIGSPLESPLAAQASHNEFHELISKQPPQVETALASLSSAIWISNSVGTEIAISPLAQVTQSKQIDSRDTTFQDYWSEAALPALKSDRSSDGADSFSELASWEEQAEQLAGDSELKEDEPQSLLEIFNGELTAIDSVLSQLHEFKWDHKGEIFSKQSHEKIDDSLQQNEVVPLPSSENLSVDQHVADLAEGGMVLLQVDGELDETQDIAAVFAQKLERAGVQPQGVEISAGIYQAFEVGNAKATQASPVATNKTARGTDTREELLSETPNSSS
jgi:hypothetical protein